MSIQQVEQIDSPTAMTEVGARRPSRSSPPDWLLLALAALYIVVLAGLVFLPGATLIERLRALDGGICAQASTHSFVLGGQQLPLCSRNTGIYLGFAATFFTLLALGRLRSTRFPGKWVFVVLIAAVLFMAEDGLNSFFLDLGLPHLYQPVNTLRLITGLGAGVAMCAFIVPIANTLIWDEDPDVASFRDLRQLGVMLPVLLIAFLAVITQAPILLYPIALLSSFGLVMALSLVNIVFLLGLTNRVGRFATPRQFFPLFSVALILAVIELMALFTLKTSVMSTLTRV
jgi:uncharacterized membrane protein